MIDWLFSKIWKRTFLMAILTLCIISSLVFGLADSVNGLQRFPLSFFALAGVLLGISLAILPFPGWMAAWISLLVSLTWLIVYFARLANPLQALLRTVFFLAYTISLWPRNPPINTQGLELLLVEINLRLASLLNRLEAWFISLASQGQLFDPLAVNFIWATLILFCGIWAGWMIFRRNQPLLAMLPAGLILAGTLNYARGEIHALISLITFGFVLLVLVSYHSRVKSWIEQKMDYAEDLLFELILISAPLIILLIAVSIITPNLSYRELVKWIDKMTRGASQESERVAVSLGVQPNLENLEEIPGEFIPGMPRSHLLGLTPRNSNRRVLVIHTGDLPPAPAQITLAQPPPHYYWRSAVYDLYTGRGWATSPTDEIEYPADQLVLDQLVNPQEAKRVVRQYVQPQRDLGGVVYAAGEILRMDQAYTIAWREAAGDMQDAFGVTTKNQDYRAESLISSASTSEIRAASGSIDPAILERYTALPETVPARVYELADSLTAVYTNTYDQATAIETYLRTFSYTLNVPAPPTGQDVADFFLFDLKRGYCDYYATAMVVLARAAGIPARLATGFASGSYDYEQARYLVTEADAHSWVEIYFPGLGWVDFEPTASQPLIIRPQKQETLPTLTAWTALPSPSILRLRLANLEIQDWLLIGGGMLIIGIVLWISWDSRQLGRLPTRAYLGVIYQRLRQKSRPLTGPIPSSDTPHEFYVKLTSSINTRYSGSRSRRIILPVQEEAESLTEAYIHAAYSQRPPTLADRLDAHKSWRVLRWRLWLCRFFK